MNPSYYIGAQGGHGSQASKIPSFIFVATSVQRESGRVMVGRHEHGRLTLEEMHRFPSAAVRLLGSLRWGVLRDAHTDRFDYRQFLWDVQITPRLKSRPGSNCDQESWLIPVCRK